MKTVSHTLTKNHVLFLTAMAIIASLLFGPATARSSWWEKGAELLKSPVGTTAQKALTSEEIGAGLKDALLVGSETVVAELGSLNGFNFTKITQLNSSNQGRLIPATAHLTNLKIGGKNNWPKGNRLSMTAGVVN